MTSSEEKHRQLGMGHGSARNILCRNLLFSMAEDLGRNSCYQCGKRIETVEEFSIDHKTPWLHDPKAAELFFDLENIAFSHFKCNVGAARSARKVTLKDDGTQWCAQCKAYKPESDFYPSYVARKTFRCRDCSNTLKTTYRNQGGVH